MIGWLRGVVRAKHPPVLLLDVGGVGYELEAPMGTFADLPAIGERPSLFTHLIVREDAHQLFGFSAERERDVFRALLKVNGVGAKVALAILSGMDGDGLHPLRDGRRHRSLTRLPGIGKKTAERLVMEMRDRLESMPAGIGTISPRTGTPAPPRDAGQRGGERAGRRWDSNPRKRSGASPRYSSDDGAAGRRSGPPGAAWHGRLSPPHPMASHRARADSLAPGQRNSAVRLSKRPMGRLPSTLATSLCRGRGSGTECRAQEIGGLEHRFTMLMPPSRLVSAPASALVRRTASRARSQQPAPRRPTRATPRRAPSARSIDSTPETARHDPGSLHHLAGR